MQAGGPDSSDDSMVDQLRIVEEEVARTIKRGVPLLRGVLDRSELISVANEALAMALGRGVTATRLTIRNKLRDRVRHEAMRMRHDGGDADRVVD